MIDDRDDDQARRGAAVRTDTGDGDRPHDDEADYLRERAMAALRAGEFDLAERVLASGDVTLGALIENLRVYQAEIEIQNVELRRSRQQVEEALAHFTALFMGLPIAELVVDHNGLVIEANPEARALLQLRDTRSHQYFLVRLVHEGDRGKVVLAWERLKDHEAMDLLETRFRPADGSALVADLHIARLPPQDNASPRFVCAVVDRTAAIQQREALAKAYERLESSEERYRVLADFSPDWDYLIGADGQFIHVSPACLQTTGYSADEFYSNPALFENIIHPDDLMGWTAHLDAPIDDATFGHPPLRLRIRTRQGRQRWIEHVCTQVASADGRFLGWRGINRDVTARREAEETLRRSNTLLEAAGRLAGVGAWELDAATGTLTWTKVTRELHGVDAEYNPSLDDALGFYDADDRQRLRAALETALAAGTPFALELRLCTGEGRDRRVKTIGMPVEDQGAITGLRGSIQDVTDGVGSTRPPGKHSQTPP